MEVISGKAFEDCCFLKEVILPHSFKEIGNRCFATCNIKELNHPLLKIENGLAIKDNRLLYCADSSLENVINPEGIEVINDRLLILQTSNWHNINSICTAVVVFPHHFGPCIRTAPFPLNLRARILSEILGLYIIIFYTLFGNLAYN